ncbi:MAG: bepE 1 [Planctomycetaceae bacterium]|nr:bepE 1 [Planctomycetaceae bacterium]
MSRRIDIRFTIRRLVIGVALAAVGLFLIRNAGGRADDVTVRRYPAAWGQSIRIRLDIERLRAYDLSEEDVIIVMTPSSLVGSPPPPPGVEFVKGGVYKLDQYEEVVLKANVEGDTVRLKDVGKVHAGW